MEWKLHHIGVAVHQLEPAVDEFTRGQGYQVVSPCIHDPIQTVYARFLRLAGESCYLELVAPDGPDSKLRGALKRSGGGLHHLCYCTNDIEAACRHLREQGMTVIQEPVAGAAFSGRRIAWLLGGTRILTELVEAGTDEWGA